MTCGGIGGCHVEGLDEIFISLLPIMLVFLGIIILIQGIIDIYIRLKNRNP